MRETLREQVYLFLDSRDDPASLTDIADALGVNWQRLVHHLREMVALGDVARMVARYRNGKVAPGYLLVAARGYETIEMADGSMVPKEIRYVISRVRTLQGDEAARAWLVSLNAWRRSRGIREVTWEEVAGEVPAEEG